MTMLEITEEQKLDTTPQEPGDHDRFAHYYSKKDLDRAMFDGVSITALCGKVDRPLRGIEGRTVCPDCKEAWEAKDDE